MQTRKAEPLPDAPPHPGRRVIEWWLRGLVVGPDRQLFNLFPIRGCLLEFCFPQLCLAGGGLCPCWRGKMAVGVTLCQPDKFGRAVSQKIQRRLPTHRRESTGQLAM